ncbi:DUF1572 domain-containing protein [Paenibacillus sp. HJL G12]|uniref:DUF1572 domain-containing protein n=1 Tax=Paenibacillus dendrobii TaxID=2691084 RepID=A0A7X3LJR0_9BACL|nr:DUF1572 domain-containing protein [Paenibacillus dendrobii]
MYYRSGKPKHPYTEVIGLENPTNVQDLGSVYLASATAKFKELKQSAEKAIAQVQDDVKLNWAPNEESNSIAIIVKHLSGNMISRWTDFLTTDGEKPGRDRDEEFEGTIESKDDLLSIWNQGWDVFLQTLSDLKSDDLLRTVYIRQQPHSVLESIERQMSHYSSHVGQIIYVAKMIQGDDWHTLTIPRKKKS